MENSNDYIKKVCSFYVSNWHLITMLIPYLKEELNHHTKITTVLEQNLEENVNILMGKIVLNVEDKNKILSINWKNDINFTEESLKRKLEGKSIAIIAGSKDYINRVNNYIDKNIKKEIKIINCFEITEINENVKEILEKYKYILNTSGVKSVEEAFGSYVS